MDITQYIDLESYSSTPGFLGYADNAPDFSEAGIDALCDDFLQKMAAYINDVTVVSSLFISSNKEELSADYDISLEKIEKFLHALLKNGMVKIIDFGAITRKYPPETAEFDREFRKLETTFTFLDTPGQTTVREILTAFFHGAGLKGHLFLVFKSAELIVYPHTDDLGFGFIGMNNKRSKEKKENCTYCLVYCKGRQGRKNEKKFKSPLAKYKNNMYIRKSSVMLDLSVRLKGDG